MPNKSKNTPKPKGTKKAPKKKIVPKTSKTEIKPKNEPLATDSATKSDKPVARKKFISSYIILAIILVFSLTIGYLVYTSLKKDTPVQQTIEKRSQDYQVDDSKPLNFKVKKIDKKTNSWRVTVVTPETKDKRLIAINDSLYEKYKGKSDNLYIDYFDSDKFADIYFKKISEPNLSEENKKNLYSHYSAVFVSIKGSDAKLYSSASPGKILKEY